MSGVFRPAGGALLGVGVGRPKKGPRQGRSSVWNPTARGGVAEPQNLVILVVFNCWWSFLVLEVDFRLVMCFSKYGCVILRLRFRGCVLCCFVPPLLLSCSLPPLFLSCHCCLPCLPRRSLSFLRLSPPSHDCRVRNLCDRRVAHQVCCFFVGGGSWGGVRNG